MALKREERGERERGGEKKEGWDWGEKREGNLRRHQMKANCNLQAECGVLGADLSFTFLPPVPLPFFLHLAPSPLSPPCNTPNSKSLERHGVEAL